ncbi:MAG: hypothetical protein ABI051_13115 [Vicinamibacterales bacterium]
MHPYSDPFSASAVHNLPWEFFYGLGFYIAGFVFHPDAFNRTIGIIGYLLWPLLATVLVFFLARIAIRSSRPWRIVAAGVFAASVMLWINHERANDIARRWPIFTIYAAANF